MRNSFLFLLILLTSCGYHLGRTSNNERVTITVPYIEDDHYGFLTNELIKNISNSNNFDYQYKNANYELKVNIIFSDTSKIGYKYYINNQGKRTDHLRPTEGRTCVTAKVEVIDLLTNKSKIEPFEISYFADFDYVDEDSLSDLSFFLDGKRTTVLAYSLGQLESIDSAKEAALKPLFEEVAKKIVDAISSNW